MDREEAIEIIRKNMPSDKSLPVYDALQTLIPELAESEDDRMVVKIALTLSFAAAHNLITDYDELLAMQNWLEKQKGLDKMIVVSPEVWDKAIADAYENGKKDGEKQKEQKPAEHSAKGRRGRMGGIPEYVRRKAEAFKDKMEPPYDADDICTAYEAGALESAKPAELEQLAKLREMTHEIRDAYERGIEVGRVESKQEWSEEDKDAINGAIGILLDDNNPNFVFPEHSKLSVGEIVKRLKYLPERFVLQPKPEWGEEDEDMLWNIISIVGQSKSIQADEMLDWLKSLRPSWKPSEEQMEALKCALADIARFSKRGGRQVELENEPYYSALHSLYCNLEKLV